MLKAVWDEHCNSGSKEETTRMSNRREEPLTSLLDFSSLLQGINMIISVFGFTVF